MKRTTVDLPAELWQRAKIHAVKDRKDLRTLIIEGLELRLRSKPESR
jgi:hypothetical protein